MTMKEKPNDVLLLAGKILTLFMQTATVIGGIALALATPIVLFFRGKIDAELIAEFGEGVGSFPAFQVAGILLLALGVLALAFVFFGKLRQIINSVGAGDPFAPENADRLNLMGWLMLGNQALIAFIAALAFSIKSWVESLDGGDFTADFGLDLTTLLTVVILFILARVFKHGAAMRDDLEGTV